MILCGFGFWNVAPAQVAPVSILEIDVENRVQYFEDTADPSKFAGDPNVTTRGALKNFSHSVIISDIAAVNGQAVTGTVVENIRMLSLTGAPAAGQAIADITRNNIQILSFEILKTDGTQIGTLMATGFGSGAAPPGVALEVTQGNNAIVGGTGAFFGVRGHVGTAATPQAVATRQASITEDPANRRLHGGGRSRFVLTLVPMSAPQVVTTAGGAMILHADFSPVSTAKPARPGELLIVQATGLGPTVPGVDPGHPFPVGAIQSASSPVSVSVNGKTAQVINAIGWPGLVNTYRVDFQVPEGTPPGTAAMQLSVAWMSGAAESFAVN